MQRRQDFILNRVEPLLYRLLTPHNVTGSVMLALALSIVDRPDATIASGIAPLTNGAITAFGAAALLALHGLYFVFRRPRPTSGWTFLAAWPLVAYAGVAWQLSLTHNTVSLALAILAVAPALYSLSFVLMLSRRESAPHVE